MDKLLNPEFIITFLLFVAFLGTAISMRRLQKKPRDSLKPSLIPHTPILLLSGFLALIALVHLMNQLGIHTGRR
jgi:amino acid transporter